MYNKIFSNKKALEQAFYMATNNYCDFDIFCDNLSYELSKNEKVSSVDEQKNTLTTNNNRIIKLNDII